MRRFAKYVIAFTIILTSLYSGNHALSSASPPIIGGGATNSAPVALAPAGDDLAFISLGGFLRLVGRFFRFGAGTNTNGAVGSGNAGILDAYGTTWHDLMIGGGGWLVGMDIAPDGTKVVRADTYGGYVWNGTKWQQLVTSQSMPASAVGVGGNAGIYEIRIAPSNTSRFYMMYEGNVYRTDNKGTTWTQTSFATTTASANDNYRMNGEKMAIDPANENVVYVSSESTGLWQSLDGGATWTNIATITTSSQGITGIAFDLSSRTTGGKTNTIYASSRGNGVWQSTDAGTTWTKLTGGPTQVDNAEVANGIYYAVDGTAAWKYSGGAWTDMLSSGGWHTIAVDPANSAHIVVANGGGTIDQSYTSGASWLGSDFSDTRVATDVPWLAWTNENYMSSGNMVFDPSASDKLYFSEGIAVWYATPPATDTGFNWNSQTAGIEQLVSNEVISPPGGHPLVGSWDRPVFSITNPDVYPSTHGPNNRYSIIAGWSLDWASNNPSFIVGDMDFASDEESGYSTDGGQTWSPFATLPPGYLQGGAIAAASSTDIVWAPEDNNNPYYTQDGGQTWTQVDAPGAPTSGTTGWGFAYYLDNQIVAADRVNIGTFYMYNALEGLYRSTDGGVTWTLASGGTVIPPIFSGFNQELKAVPNEAGNLFLTGGPSGSGIITTPANEYFYSSTDGGTTWSAVPNMLEVRTFGFGAPAVPGGYPAIYVVGWYNDQFGIWRSTNDASTWTQVGEWPRNSIDNIKAISGDMNTYGRIYVGFSGSGYAYGDTSDAAPSAWLTAPITSSTVSGSFVTLTATPNGSVPIAHVQFEADGTNIGAAISAAPYTISWNSTGVADGSHTLYAIAEGTSGAYATSSVSVTVDNTAPVISSISSGTPASATSTITWTTDKPATSEVVYGTSVSYGSASSSASLVTPHSIGLTSLSASTIYHYAVVSVDNQGNTATSSDQTFTTAPPDITPPSTPTNLTATASSTQDEIDLSWTASNDNGGGNSVTGYQVFRNSIQIATSTQTTYADTGLTASTTYTYIVTAFDTAGNVSASSTSATATTTGGVTWTATASPAIQNINFAGHTATFSSTNIGTPSSDRQVVVGVANNASTDCPLASVTIGGASATEATTTTSAAASLWYANITSGTSADIVVTCSPGVFALVGIEVGTLTGASATPSSTGAHQSSINAADPQAIPGSGSITVPTDGVAVVFGKGGSTGANTVTWTGASTASGDFYVHNETGNTMSALMAHTYQSGSDSFTVRGSIGNGFGFDGFGAVVVTWAP